MKPMNVPSQESLEPRLERLERSLRRCRIGLFGGLLLLAVASLAALATRAFGRTSPGPAQELVVRSLVLVDGEGETRARLGMTKAGPVLALLDENGLPRAALRVDAAGPAVSLLDKRGKVVWRAP
jgi:hypothetical protein